MARQKKTKRVGTLKKVAIYYGVDLTNQYDVDPIALNVLKWLKGKVSRELWNLLHNMILGYCDDMQLEIANDLWDFTSAHIIRTTGCYSVDTMLIPCYKMIAEEQGFKILHIDKILNKVL